MKTQLTFGSLFAGIGGLDLGFERAGMACKWQVEIDPYARQVLEKHWPDVPKHDDIRTFKDAPHVDIIAGGFPCQDISYAGKGAGLAGERSGLFYEVIRVVGEMGPRIVVLENVAALLTRGMGDVLGSLASIGFHAEWHCIPAAAVGAPHIRDRAFILAYASGSRFEAAGTCQGDHQNGENPGERRDSFNELGDDGGARVLANSIGKGLPASEQEVIPGSRGREKGRAASECGWWPTEPAVGRVAHGIPRRVDRLKCLGNAIVPQVAEWIGRCIVAAAN